MGDSSISNELREFMAERNWEQFHSPANLAKSISIEAAELLECFQWSDAADLDEARMELADVLTYAYLLAGRLDRSPESLIREKLEITRRKYPIAKAYGTSAKYDQL